MIASGEWWHIQTHKDFLMRQFTLWDFKLQTRPLLMFHYSIAPALLGNIDFSKYDIFTHWFFRIIIKCVVKEMCYILNARNSDINEYRWNKQIILSTFFCSIADHNLSNFIDSLALTQERLTENLFSDRYNSSKHSVFTVDKI